MGCYGCESRARMIKGCNDNQVQGYAIFDTTTDGFVTSCWPYRMCEKILKLWGDRGRYLFRFEIRARNYDDPGDNRCVLLVGREDNIVYGFYHWDNRGYALAYDEGNVFPVIYTPSGGLDITDVQQRFGRNKWDGQGDKTTFRALKEVSNE